MKPVIGQPAPTFELPSHLDSQVDLRRLRGGNIILAFFPQAWTPV